MIADFHNVTKDNMGIYIGILCYGLKTNQKVFKLPNIIVK